MEATTALLTFVEEEKACLEDFYATISDWEVKQYEQSLMSEEELLSVRRETWELKDFARGGLAANNTHHNTYWKMKVLNATRLQNASLQHSITELEREIYELTQA